jgi:hypothetical protein
MTTGRINQVSYLMFVHLCIFAFTLPVAFLPPAIAAPLSPHPLLAGYS